MRLASGIVAVLVAGGCTLPAPEDADGAPAPRGFLTSPSQAEPAEETAEETAGQILKVKPLREALLAGGDVILRGPDGYCIDPETVESRPRRSFAIMASCHILSGGDEGAPRRPALMTVTLGPVRLTSSRPGAQALADEAGVPLVAGFEQEGITLALLGQGGDAVLDGGDTRYWRAAFTVKARIMGVALYAPEGSPLTRDDGARLLQALRAQVTERNAAPEPVADAPAAPEPVEADQTATAAPNFLQRLFKRNEVR